MREKKRSKSVSEKKEKSVCVREAKGVFERKERDRETEKMLV